MSEHLCAFNASPAEGGVGEPVELTPAHLLCQQVMYSRALEYLRHGSRVPENVRNPAVGYFHSEFVHEEVLAMHHLTHH